jgi:hypothetical protein
MARSRSSKTSGVKATVPTTETQPTDIQQTVATPQPVAVAAPATMAEPATKAEATKPQVTATKSPAVKLEAVRSETRGTVVANNVVPINLDEEIRRLAYLLSERRGFAPGYENEDWLTAEHEVRQRYRQHAQSA